MLYLDGLTAWILMVLRLLALGSGVYALIHAVRQRPDAFTAADKLTKPIWLGILAGAVLLLVISQVVMLLGIIAVIAIGVYLADVRPRVEEIQRGPRW
ncbi:MAG: DUF2516 family protein [Mycobacteriaceae bacterium]|nr:DUF2516 family protein [Mycobacteriaceae bacterium]